MPDEPYPLPPVPPPPPPPSASLPVDFEPSIGDSSEEEPEPTLGFKVREEHVEPERPWDRI